MAPRWGPAWQGGREAVGLQLRGVPWGELLGFRPLWGWGELRPSSTAPISPRCPAWVPLPIPAHSCLSGSLICLSLAHPMPVHPCPTCSCLPILALPVPVTPGQALGGGGGWWCHTAVHTGAGVGGGLTCHPVPYGQARWVPLAPLPQDRSPAPRCCRLLLATGSSSLC